MKTYFTLGEKNKMSEVEPGMDPKEIAILHYELLIENNYDEWLKTINTTDRNQAGSYGSSPYFWWDTGRRYVEKYGYQYKFKNVASEDENRVKFFFHRLDKNGKPQGTGQVPIHVIRDEEDNNEWRVEVSSW